MTFNTGISNERPLISVVVPVYNSGKIVRELCSRLETALEKLCNNQYEIILVDDCSTDDVWSVIKELASQKPKIKGHRLGNNAGQFMAQLAGIGKATGEYIVTIDDDLEYDPADIEILYKLLKATDYYLVFGIAPAKYQVKNVSTLRSQLRNRIINFIWQKFLTDSFKIFKRELVFTGDTLSAKVHFEAYVKHVLNPRYVGYAEVSYQPRFAGISGHNLCAKLRIFLRYSIEYYRSPLINIASAVYLVFGLFILLKLVFFRYGCNWPLFAGLGFILATLTLLILLYAVHIYKEVRNIPDYWIIESTENHKP